MASFKRSLPNLLTGIRFAGGPAAAVWLHYARDFFPNLTAVYFWTTVMFTALVLTDWLDGFLARRFDARTRFGAFFDPLADKVLVWSFFAVFFLDADSFFPRLIWAVLLGILIFDGISTAMRAARWSRTTGNCAMEANRFGKRKTAFVYGSIFCVLAAYMALRTADRFYFGGLGEVAWLIHVFVWLIFASWALLVFAFLCSLASFAVSCSFRAQ